MQYYLAISAVINAVIALLLGAYIFFKKKGELANKLYFLLALVTSLGLLCVWRWLKAGGTETILASEHPFSGPVLAIKLFLICSAFFSVLFFHFVSKFLNLIKNNFILIFYYCVSFLYSFAVTLGYLFSKLAPTGDFGLWPNANYLFILFFITHFIALPLYLFYLLIVDYYQVVSVGKLRIKYILAASLIGYGAWMTNFLLWFGFNIAPIGMFIGSFFLIVLAYVLISFRLIDLRLIFSKIYFYTILILFLYLYFYVVYYIDTNYFDGGYSPKALTFGIFSAFVFLLVFIPFINYVQKIGDIIFFKGYNPQKVIKDILIRLTSVINLEELLDILADEFKKAIGVENAGFLVFNYGDITSAEEGYKFNPSINLSYIFQPSENLLNKLRQEKKMLIRDELGPGEKDIATELDFHHINNLAPLIFKDKIIGLIIMNNKVSQEGFTREDAEFIEMIGTQASVAIVNAILYKQLHEMGETEKERFTQEVSEIKEQAENLQDFFKVSSQHLQNEIGLAKEFLRQQISETPAHDGKSPLKDSYAKLLKLADIINDILRASEMDSADFEFETDKVDLKKLLKKIISDVKYEAELKNIFLKLDLPKDTSPLVSVNEFYIKQAITSLINNAIQYTMQGGVTVSAEDRIHEVRIRITDTGIGIPQSAIPHLFEKFSRAKNAAEIYKEGSGLGLYIVKKLGDHRGKKNYRYGEDNRYDAGHIDAQRQVSS